MSKELNQARQKLLFIFLEGKTEDVFYKKIMEKYLKTFAKKYTNLQTGTNVNTQIAKHLYHFLEDGSNSKYDLYVYAFIDREGSRSSTPQFNEKAILEALKKQNVKTNNIKKLGAIEAIIMIESWFFYDLEGICKYINLKCTETLKKNCFNAQKFKSSDLSDLFRKGKNKKPYKKGEKSFLNCLDIEKIYKNCSDLRVGIEDIIKDIS